MNQVAVVIGGGQTLGAFLCHGLAAEGYRVAVVDIQSDCIDSLEVRKKPGGHWIIRDLAGLDLVGLASL
ncbi:sorbitol-6-phosphate 2-dehydrogenase, partial [Escherichia coli KOEGE 56 (169a)]